MALKFLNKKGWHTGSLRNIENVWKAEQKHDAEQKKLEELRKQIQEERERAEFRQLQEQAGLVPRQERLDFLYESGLGVGKGSSEGFKALQAPSQEAGASSSAAPAAAAAAVGSSDSKAAVPGALFEDKPQSANDAWRKLHSDPLLLIRRREQEALARIKNNPIQMAMIRKTAEAEKQKDKQEKKEKRGKKEHKKRHRHKSNHEKHSLKAHLDAGGSSDEETEKIKKDNSKNERHEEYSKSKRDRHSSEVQFDPKEKKRKIEDERSKDRHYDSNDKMQVKEDERNNDQRYDGKHERQEMDDGRNKDRNSDLRDRRREREDGRNRDRLSDLKGSRHGRDDGRHKDRPLHEHRLSESLHVSNSRHDEKQSPAVRQDSGYNRHRAVPKLTAEEREARLREMQLNAELHEEQRWKRLKNASEVEAQDSVKDRPSVGRNFLDAAKKSMYGTEKGGSSTIEESVRRRTYYLQGGSRADESNAFRRC